DGTKLAPAIPVITTDFESLDEVAWYGSFYLFCTCSVQLMFGKLYSFHLTKWIFFSSVLIFELGSLMCGVAPTSTAFIIGRSISGLGAGAVPLRIRSIYTSLISSMHSVASVAGPILVGLVIFSIIGGIIASAIGYYTPLLLISSIITSVGAGMLTTLKVNSIIGYWFGYQVLLSAGAGFGVQNVMLVPQVAVPAKDMSMAVSILTFTQTLSSAIFLPVGQSVFQNRLVSNLESIAPDVNGSLVLQTGATSIRDHFSSNQLLQEGI
ncbi:hypothetical protein BGW36DRAFT_448924, partial [Talaromyces proteolyticus]